MIKRIFPFLTLLVMTGLLACFVAIDSLPVTAQEHTPVLPEAVPPFNGATATEQNGGFWSRQPSGTTAHLHGVHFVNANLGWAVGSGGTIVTTSDGGNSWSTQSSGVTVDLSDVYFVDENTGWAVGYSGTILHTTDGGTTWSIQRSDSFEYLSALDFVDALHGWVINQYSATILYTDDGGTTWNTQSLPESMYYSRALDFWDQNSGWVVDPYNGFFATTDGGTTWVQQITNDSGYITGIDFISATEGWVAGYHYEGACSSLVFHTTDGGNTWAEIDNDSCGYASQIDFVDATNGWLLLSDYPQNQIVATTDGGVEWTEQHADFEVLSDLQMLDAQNGWAVGHNGTILRYIEGQEPSTISGRVSDLLHSPLLDVTISGSTGHPITTDSHGYYTMTGFITGTYTITATKNGYTFEPESYTVSVPPDATELDFVGTKQTYSISGKVTDSSGKPIFEATIKAGEQIMGTTDSNGEYTISGLSIGDYTLTASKSGYSSFSPSSRFVSLQNADVTGQDFIEYQPSEGFWSPQSSGTTVDLHGVHFVNANLGWAVGSGGTIVSTSDGGNSWTTQSSGVTVDLKDVYFADGNTGWAVGASGTILHTSDGGSTWSMQSSNSSEDLFALDFVHALHGWVIGRTTILYTDDGGTTWNTQTLPETQNFINGLDFWDQNRGWVANSNYGVFATTDGGTTWVHQATNDSLYITGIDFISATEGWATGSDYPLRTVVFHTTDGGKTWQELNNLRLYMRAIAFSDQKNGFAIAQTNETIPRFTDYRKIMATTDGGVEWRVQHSASNELNDLQMLDSQNGWAVGDYGTILRYIEGQEPFTISGRVSDLQGRPFSGVTISSSTSHRTSSDSHGYYTMTRFITGTYTITATNYGYQFEPESYTVSLPPDATKLNFVGRVATYSISGKVTDSSGKPIFDATIKVGEQIMTTTDSNGEYTISGLTMGDYTLTASKSGYTFFSPFSRLVSIENTNITGQDFIAHLPSEGFWSPQPSGTTASLNGVHFVNANLGWAVGDGGTIVATSDGGNSWSTQSSAVTVDLKDVYFADGNTGWAVGRSGTILHTSDGGSTWSMQSSNSFEDLFALDFVDALHGWVVSNDSIVYTHDGGTTWNSQTLPETVGFNYFNALDFWDQNRGWVVGWVNGVFATTDGGTTWVQQATNGAIYMSGIDFISPTEGWAVGYTVVGSCSGSLVPMVFHTTDAGNTWTEIDNLSCGYPPEIDFVDATNGWLLLSEKHKGYIVSTIDGGVEWTEQHADSENLNDLQMVDAQNGWAVGDNGTILRYIGESATIFGNVIDTEGVPLSDVTISSSAGVAVESDRRGDYILGGLLTGTYTISATLPGYTFEPLSVTLSVPPDVTGQDFVGTLLTYSISGQVTDGSGNPLSDVTVSAGAGVEVTTDSSGNYTIPDLAPGNYTLVPLKEGYTFEPPSRPATLPDGDLTGQDFVGTATPQAGDPPPSSPSDQPLIENVQACLAGPFYFQPSGSMLNPYSATVDWQGLTAQGVEFSLNEHSESISTNGQTAAYAFDLKELNYLEEGARNTIQVQATSADGATSWLSSLIAIGIDQPSWLSFTELDMPPACLGAPMKARASLLSEPALSATVTPPDELPFIGGQEIALQAQARTEIELRGDGEGAVELKGPSRFEIAGQEIASQVDGKGEAGVRDGIYLDKVSFAVDITGNLPAHDKVVDVICASQEPCPEIAESESLFGGVVRSFFATAELKANLKPRIDMAFTFEGNRKGLPLQSGAPQWHNGTDEGQIEYMLSEKINMIDGLSASAYGGGESQMTIEMPGNSLSATFDLFSALNLNVWGWQKTFSASHSWDSLAQQRANTRFRATDWRPIPRSSRTDGTEDRNNGILRTNAQHNISEELIALNIFPESHPVIAAGNTSLILWVDDEVNQPQTQSQEIYYSVYDQGAWSTPDRITTDNLQDFAPQIAFHANGSAVAVWERNKTVQSQASQFNADYANAFEVAYSVWNGTSWSPPTLLTDNDVLDHAPILVQGGDGNPLLVWRQNAAGTLVGTTSAPDTIYYSIWNGIEWDNPQPLKSNASGILGVTAARHDADKMSVVYAQDTDGDLATANDLELFATNWDGSNWSTATQLTDDNQPDYKASLFYDGDGAPRLLWLKGHTLYAQMQGSLSDTPQVVSSSATMNDYTAAQDQSGNLALVWASYSDDGADLFYTTYDQQHEIFSWVQQLTHDEPLENAFAPTFAPTGEMLMVYNKTALISETVTVSPTLTINDVTTFGNTDLAFMSHSFAPELTVSEMSVMPANPVPGSTAFVNITVRNTGDRALTNPFVTLYLGDPTDGGSSIGSSSAKVTLAGGMTSTLTVNFSVPTSGGPFALYAVADPNQQINEQDETNNTAHLLLSLPDLLLEHLQITYNETEVISLTATISNTGLVATEPFTVNFLLNDPYTGTLIATAHATSLSAGASQDIQVTWDSSSYPAGRYKVYALADADEMIAEHDESNNREWASVAVLPELSLRPSGSLIGTNPDGSLLASVWVFNTAGRQANDITVALYDQMPTPLMTPLISTTISVPAAQYQVVTLQLAEYPNSGLYAGVVIGEPDRDLSNNVLVIGEPKYSVYLPIILQSRFK